MALNRFTILNENSKKVQEVPVKIASVPKTWANMAASPMIKPITKPNIMTQPIEKNSIVQKNNGKNYVFSDEYTLWYHSVTLTDWSIGSFEKMCTIRNVSDLWRMINNFDMIGYRNRHLFLMKNNIEPLWEHEENRKGGVCSFRVEVHNSIEIYEKLCLYMVLNILCNYPNDITGVSFSPKGNWAFVKVWNKNSDNDLSKTLSKDLLTAYSNLSIKYRANKPEY